MLLEILLKEDLKCDNDMYLVTIREVKGEALSVFPKAFALVLKEFIE